MRPAFLISLYLAVIIFPLLISSLRISPPRPFWDEIASGAGLLAFAIILVEFVLSGRFRTVSNRIGMDKTMRFHQLLARTALVLAIIHPFLYVSPFNTQLPWDTTRELTLATDITALSTGVLAWVILPGFVLLSIARDRLPFSYETWRLMHGLGAVIIGGCLMHHAMHAGRYSPDPALRAFWLVMVGGALLSLLIVYIGKPILQRMRPWTVKSVRPVALKTWEITVEPEGHAGLRYLAGQFAWLNIGNSPFSLKENPFSISSAPSSGQAVHFIIKELGDFTATLGQLKPGAKAYLDGPHGNLVIRGRKEKGIALIAGGVGIAPLLSILQELHLAGDVRPTILIYGNRVEEQIIRPDELNALTEAHGTQLVHVLSEPPAGWQGQFGMVDKEKLADWFGAPDKRNWLYVLCGPPEMMDIVEDTLISLGISADQILSERFKYD